MPFQPLTTVVAIITAGIVSLILGSKLRLPSILFLLLSGVFLGPEFADLIQPHFFREYLPLWISLMVALILFEKASTLRFSRLKEISRALRGLLTAGPLLTLPGMALLAHWITGMPWFKCLIFGSIMTVTGPTVVAPILQRVAVRDKLHELLKWEAILTNPIGVVIAVVLFEFLLNEHTGWLTAFTLFLGRFFLGGAAGAAAGGCMYLGLTRRGLLRHEGEEIGGLFMISVLIFFYGMSEILLPHSGLVTATVSGLIIGNKKFPFRERIVHFKDQITQLALAVLFVIISSSVPVRSTPAIFKEGLILLASLVFVFRPLTVFLGTAGDPALDLKEKAFLAAVAPRGIVSASLAAYFAFEFEERNLTGRGLFLPLSFIVIIGSIVLYSLLAVAAVKVLGIQRQPGRRVLMAGANPLGIALGEELRNRGFQVFFIDTNPLFCQNARNRYFEVYCGSGFDRTFIESFNLEEFGALVALTSNHEVNILCCQAFSNCLEKSRVFRMWDPSDAAFPATAALPEDSPANLIFIPGPGERRNIWRSLDRKDFRFESKAQAEPLSFTNTASVLGQYSFFVMGICGTKIISLQPGISFPAGTEILLFDLR